MHEGLRKYLDSKDVQWSDSSLELFEEVFNLGKTTEYDELVAKELLIELDNEIGFLG